MEKSLKITVFQIIVTLLLFNLIVNILAEEENAYENIKYLNFKFNNVTKKCAAKLNFTGKALQTAQKYDHSFLNQPELLKCYSLCILQEFGLMNENGDFNKEKIANMLRTMPKSRNLKVLKAYIDVCFKQDDDNKCEKSYKFIKCFYDNVSGRILQPRIYSSVSKDDTINESTEIPASQSLSLS